MKRYAEMTPKIQRRKAQQFVAKFVIRMADSILIVRLQEIFSSSACLCDSRMRALR
jgi:hypothetical protein